MQKYDIHVCLVSTQAAANLLPVLDSAFKPKEAIFIVSQDMEDEANALKLVFEAQGIQVSQKHIKSISDFEYLEKYFTLLCEENKNKNIALNATGGTKSMVIAGNNIFRKYDKAVFYLEAKNNRIFFLYQSTDGSYFHDFELDSEITLETYLAAYGIRANPTITNINPSRLNAMIAVFINGYNTFHPYVYKLNWYSNRMKNFRAELLPDDLTDANFMNLLKQLSTADKNKGIVKFDGKVIDYKNHDEKFFTNGGWFEEFAYMRLKENTSVKDIQCGLHVNNDIYGNEYLNDDFNRNELDVAFIAKDKLHIIECKTSQISANEGAKYIYKLEALKKYGGSMTKTCLVSYEKVPSAVKQRAKSAGVHIISGFDLKEFDKHIAKWIEAR